MMMNTMMMIMMTTVLMVLMIMNMIMVMTTTMLMLTMVMQELSAILEEKQVTLEAVKQQAEALLDDLPGPERQSVELLVRQVQAQHTQVSAHSMVCSIVLKVKSTGGAVGIKGHLSHMGLHCSGAV